ncbi:MAG: hypothetical protein RMJ56_03775 [Gemmataceae bacterium]|nr:hypothetical protein [Gemmata sp.]MDW8196708.1 hypothetical protein [Gemmataceae bacterium]
MRRRRQVLSAIAILLTAFGLAVAGLLYTVKSVPDFYVAADHPSDWDTHESSARFLTRVLDLQNDIRSKEAWGDTFSVEEINSFFIENLGPGGKFTDSFPAGFHSPRIAIDGDRLLLGIRYRQGFWSTVIWLELKVWLVAGQTNLAAIEICHLRAGGLSFGSLSLLDKIAEFAREMSMDVTWYRNGKNPVGLVRFFAQQPRATSQVLTLEVSDGKIVVAGRTSLEIRPAGTLNPSQP